MKMRMVYTKFWDDNYILKLTAQEKLLFIYLLTNSNVNLSGIYELPDQKICFDCGVNGDWLEATKEKLMIDRKFIFLDGYIKIVNYEKFNSAFYSGEKIEVAKNKELNLIPDRVLKKMHTLSIEYARAMHSSNIYININNKYNNNLNSSSNINNKSSSNKVNTYSEDFQEFWKHYPNKVGKKAAWKSWQKASDRPALVDILAKLEEQKKTDQWQRGYIPNPATWLNQGRWEDELKEFLGSDLDPVIKAKYNLN